MNTPLNPPMHPTPKSTKLTLALMAIVPLWFAIAALGTKVGIWGWQFGLLTMTIKGGPILLGILGLVALVSLVLAIRARPRRTVPLAVAAVALLAVLGMFGASVTASTRIGDDRTATIAALRDADAEVVVTTGGTGGSHADQVRRALDELGADYLVPGLASRPGGPTLLARLPDGRLVLGLAGNPLAALLGLLSLGDVLVAGFTGRVLPPLASVPIPASVKRHPHATRLVPVRAGLDEVQWTGSAMMRGLAAATGVLVVPAAGDGDVLPLPWGL